MCLQLSYLQITNLPGRLDSLEDLVEDQRDLIANQTGTIERQNELIARQSELIVNQTEMLATISTMITNQNKIFLEDCFVNCSLTINSRIEAVSYKGLELVVNGRKHNFYEEKFFDFNSCDRYRPGALTIEGSDVTEDEKHCKYSGLILHCIANDISNPWHNFVTDQTHWKLSDGSTPCKDDNGWAIGTAWKIPFVKKMKDAGATQIWSNAQKVTLFGSPAGHE